MRLPRDPLASSHFAGVTVSLSTIVEATLVHWIVVYSELYVAKLENAPVR